ncbi:MAG: N-formylglutamate amidohydrolase [Burkholderiaceae bacterium]|jgi:N-formylglutamate deformylase|nr:N-formylglutamate amidohydrolase [Burkholderiaceae bacterium]
MSQNTAIPPVSVLRPAQGALPIVIDSPHSGTAYPADFGYSAPFELLRRGEDLYVDRLYEHAPQFGATFIAANFPRAYIDPNRLLADIDEALLDAPWPGPVAAGPKTQLGIGLIWRLLGDVPVYQRTLTVAEVQERIERCYQPYHAALDEAIAGAYRQFGAVWHLNVHSMPDDSYERLKLPVKPLADFVLGDLDGRTAGEPLMALIEGVLRDHGYSVARNDPFKGVEIIARNGRPAERRHSLQIEVKRSCYADVTAHAPNEGFARVQRALDAMMAALADHVRQACAPGS